MFTLRRIPAYRPRSHPFSTISSPPILLTRSTTLPGLSYLSLNRPAAKNALSVDLVNHARAAVEEVRFDGSVSLPLFSFPTSSAFGLPLFPSP